MKNNFNTEACQEKHQDNKTFKNVIHKAFSLDTLAPELIIPAG